MSNVLSLKDALYQKLISETCLTDDLDSFEVDIRTGEENITIGEATPNTINQHPFLGFSIPKTEPITKYDSSGCYMSKVMFHVVTCDSAKTTKIADTLQQLLSVRPVEALSNWFYDVSNSCLHCKFSRFISRMPLSPRRFDDNTDVFTEILESSFIWTYCPCSGKTSDNTVDETVCDTTVTVEDYDIECDDCED